MGKTTPQVQRCLPNHYVASWINLPSNAAHLRNVPETLVAIINGQVKGEKVEPFQEQAVTGSDPKDPTMTSSESSPPAYGRRATAKAI
jgi:hypothetical protein